MHRSHFDRLAIGTAPQAPRVPVHVPLPRNLEQRPRQRLILDRDRDAFATFDAAVCPLCERSTETSQKAVKLMQLPAGLLGFLPLSVALPLLYPVLITFLVAMRKTATPTLPICASCLNAHRRGQRARRVTTIATAGFALTAPAMIILTATAHVVVACVWTATLALLMGTLLAVRKRTEARVLICERIDDERVALSVPATFADAVVRNGAEGVGVQRMR